MHGIIQKEHLSLVGVTEDMKVLVHIINRSIVNKVNYFEFPDRYKISKLLKRPRWQNKWKYNHLPAHPYPTKCEGSDDTWAAGLWVSNLNAWTACFGAGGAMIGSLKIRCLLSSSESDSRGWSEGWPSGVELPDSAAAGEDKYTLKSFINTELKLCGL